ncbi:MAG: hypothetical protein ACREBS_00595 [Nitrososphaerales archaeon]
MLSDQTILYLLIAGNVIAYTLLIVAFSRRRPAELPTNVTIEQAFKILESSLYECFPDLPEGYTWKEVMTRLKGLGTKSELIPIELMWNWSEIEFTLKKYEAFRYGGIEYHNANTQLVLQLAKSLFEGTKVAS